MTDNEIIKALECCVNGEDCPNCPLQEQFADCKPMTGALDLINRQKAEIERLKKGYFEVEEAVIKTAKAEAVKEFAERLKKCSQWLPLIAMPDPFVTVSDIDDLVKEMVGADNG